MHILGVRKQNIKGAEGDELLLVLPGMYCPKTCRYLALCLGIYIYPALLDVMVLDLLILRGRYKCSISYL
jgi:hypothetical protein